MAIGSCPDFRVSYNLLLLVYWKKLIYVQKQGLLYPWQIINGSLIVVINLNWMTVKMIKKDGNSFLPFFIHLFIYSFNKYFLTVTTCQTYTRRWTHEDKTPVSCYKSCYSKPTNARGSDLYMYTCFLLLKN